MLFKFLAFFILSTSVFGQTVVTSLPEFRWVVKQLDPKVKVISLLEGSEDPHFVDATPGFIFKVAKAKLLILNGLELEVGWLPKVIEMSGNSSVQIGAKGYCDASKDVKKIGQIQNYDRSMGDVHPQGNPHYTTSLLRMQESALSIANCLKNSGISGKKIDINLNKLQEKLQTAFIEIRKKVKSKTYYIYHREFNYLAEDFNLSFKQSLEKVPGVLPSANYLVKIAKKVKKDKPSFVLAGNTSPTKILEKFKEISSVDYKKLPLHPRVDEDYLAFIKKLMEHFN